MNNKTEFMVYKTGLSEKHYSVVKIVLQIKTKVFEGTICECDSFIRLFEKGYLKL
jgi:hypothetical protein